MGCGESKHAVSTADTISQSKRSSDHTKYEKIPQNNEKENAAPDKPENIGEKEEKEGETTDQVSSAEANVKGSESVSNEKEGAKTKAEDVVDQAKGETGVEKVKEDEIKEVPPAVALVESKAENEEPKKEENEASPIKQKDAQKSEEPKELINAGEEKIPSVEEKADESAAKDAKST